MAELQASTAKPRKERKENADKRRRQLLDAALRSIIAIGLAKTTLATVAAEAGLSQGVAVFYYKSKNGLLTAVLDDLYQKYEDNWQSALNRADDDPRSQLVAIIEADFSEAVCNPETLSAWFAFWGEQKFTPQYAELTGKFDINRTVAIRVICRRFYSDAEQKKADEVCDWVDTLTDGYWQRIHLFPDECTRKSALDQTMSFLSHALPDF